MRHFASPAFWDAYRKLPASVRALADKNFELLKENPRHPALHLKQIDRRWSVRVGLRYRALAIEVDDGLLWFWIGSHADYDRLIGQPLRQCGALIPTGTHMPEVFDNPQKRRFEMETSAGTAFSDYRLKDGVLTVLHTEIPGELEGQGLGSRLARGVLEAARARGLKVVAKCPFVAAYMKRHKEFDDLRV